MLWLKGVNVMIEIIYQEEQKKEENQPNVQIPKNIRQIGEIRGQKKIYVEDYAYTFLQKISTTPEETGTAAILYGVQCCFRENTYVFVKSALLIENMEITKEHVVFTDEIWKMIYEKSKVHFPDQEIVGWFISIPGMNMQISEPITKAHINHFSGGDKVLFVSDPSEKEENFWVYENNQMHRQSGYYVYYEKNEPMQSYMIEYNKNKSIEETEKVPDRVVTDFRKVSQEKKSEKEGKIPYEKYINVAMGACAALAVFAIGSIYFRRHQAAENINQNIVSQKEIVQEQKEEQVPVSVAEAEVTLTPTVTATPTQAPLYDPDAEQAEESQEPETDALDSDLKQQETEQTDDAEETVSVGNNVGNKEYIIQRGDTLTSICKSVYGTIAKIDEICEVNDIAPEDFIYPGQKLILP